MSFADRFVEGLQDAVDRRVESTEAFDDVVDHRGELGLFGLVDEVLLIE